MKSNLFCIVLFFLLGQQNVFARLCDPLAVASKYGWTRVSNHPTDEIYYTSPPKNIAELASLLRGFRSHEKTKITSAESASLDHQQDLVGPEQAIMRKLNITTEVFEVAVHYSDMGKLASYKDLLLVGSSKSDFLLDALKLDPKLRVSEVLKQWLHENGFENKSILNQRLSNSEIRNTFQKVGPLTGFFHELPGLADAMALFENGVVQKQELKDIFTTIFFHNGPQEGFWKKITEIFVPGAFKKSELEVSQFVEGTVFADSQGNLRYPSPQGASGIFHTIIDRVSQGTRGGVVKIIYETSTFLHPLRAAAELLIQNPSQTLIQLRSLKNTIASSEKLNPAQRTALTQTIDEALHRIQIFSDEVKGKLANYAEIEKNLADFSYIPEQLVLSGKVFNKNAFSKANVENFVRLIQIELIKIEESTGDPMRAYEGI